MTASLLPSPFMLLVLFFFALCILLVALPAITFSAQQYSISLFFTDNLLPAPSLQNGGQGCRAPYTAPVGDLALLFTRILPSDPCHNTAGFFPFSRQPSGSSIVQPMMTASLALRWQRMWLPQRRRRRRRRRRRSRKAGAHPLPAEVQQHHHLLSNRRAPCPNPVPVFDRTDDDKPLPTRKWKVHLAVESDAENDYCEETHVRQRGQPRRSNGGKPAGDCTKCAPYCAAGGTLAAGFVKAGESPVCHFVEVEAHFSACCTSPEPAYALGTGATPAGADGGAVGSAGGAVGTVTPIADRGRRMYSSRARAPAPVACNEAGELVSGMHVGEVQEAGGGGSIPRMRREWRAKVAGLTTFFLLAQPKTGGDTLYSSQVLNFRSLSTIIQGFLRTLKATHTAVGSLCSKQGGMVRRDPIETVHPVVRRHPITGEEVLYVNKQFTCSIVGMKREESDLLLNFLYDHIVRVKWEPMTMVLWDNCITAHTATYDYAHMKVLRHGARISAQAERPIPALSSMVMED
ncbi:hypothetical protein FB451DRAFT_1181773 [Mycena latifolia]|nr:hypothetical protein FB451DRAFT_1181773 [Mycena latifolia]